MSKFIPNSFQVPNAVVDELMAELSGAELKIYLFVLRKTKGWNKEADAISVSQFMEACNLSNRKVIDGCNRLVELGLLAQGTGSRGTKIFSVKNYTCEESSLVNKVHSTCEESSLVTSEVSSHTKYQVKNTTKNTNIKIDSEQIHLAFAEFWKAGLPKVGKDRAFDCFRRAWVKHNQSAETKTTLSEFVLMLTNDIKQRLKRGQFGFDKLHPSTYLNQQRWKDEMPLVNLPYHKQINGRPNQTSFADKDYGKTNLPEWAKD